jgi:hypothetical protein
MYYAPWGGACIGCQRVDITFGSQLAMKGESQYKISTDWQLPEICRGITRH